MIYLIMCAKAKRLSEFPVMRADGYNDALEAQRTLMDIIENFEKTGYKVTQKKGKDTKYVLHNKAHNLTFFLRLQLED